MNKQGWIAVVIAAVLFGAGGFYIGTSHAAQTPTAGVTRAFAVGGGGRAAFAGSGFQGAGGATFGTVIQIGNGSFTIQLPTSTSSSATTGTKLVLVDNSMQVTQMENVPTSNLQVGQTVIVSGNSNSDGSVTASSVQIVPAGARRPGSTTATSSRQ